MKHLLKLLFLLPTIAHASFPPFTGTFSNANKESLAQEKYTRSTLKQKINLVVTVNSNGQQFFIQCFTGNELGFGVITTFRKPRTRATINAGPECPSISLKVELDFEEAYIRTVNNGWAKLMRGNIDIPFKH